MSPSSFLLNQDQTEKDKSHFAPGLPCTVSCTMDQAATNSTRCVRSLQAVASHSKASKWLHVSQIKAVVVVAFCVSNTADSVWRMGEHEIHGHCRRLDVLDLLLFD